MSKYNREIPISSNAIRLRKKRAKETITQRTMRLESNKLRKQNKMNEENPFNKQQRLKNERIRISRIRVNEKSIKRKSAANINHLKNKKIRKKVRLFN